ncbi:lysylphosphatidylglycerol synthase domain-containing protein [Lapillicoccus sp.]|uniref:lysylphosphatidylglycerol synthase domain-containing protein n=1 Tax=Lapillicoccus sp. TaxID=1909287 RepID=UPI0025EF50D4|nr:lysylphosphatidylglycerol synthase domain-containing protein [Lapillicoccus sp.]
MTRDRALSLLRVAVALLVLAVVVLGVARSWSQISVDLTRVDIGSLALSTLFAAVGTLLTMLGWRVLLTDLGSPLHLAPAAGVFFVGQLGKYLPGSVWSVVAQADMASRLGVPRRRTGVVGLVAIGLSIVTGLLVGLPAVPHLIRTGGAPLSAALLVSLVVLLVLCWPATLNRVVALGLRVLRREPLERELSTRAVLLTVGLYILAWLCFGGHLLVLARAVGGTGAGAGLTTAALTGYALSGSLGTLTVILPAGLGAREGLLTLVLGSALSTPGAAAVAILSRFVVTVVDVLAAFAGWTYARRHQLLTSAGSGAAGDPANGTSAGTGTGTGPGAAHAP